jgi:site-specific recombinase XerD
MDADLLDFLQETRLKVASTTYQRKKWQIQTWFKYLESQGIDYAKAKKQDVESFLLTFSGSRHFRQSVCCVIREFYEFHKLQNPASEIKFEHDDSIKLPNVPAQAVIHEIIENLSGENVVLLTRDGLILELAYGSGLRRDELRKTNIEDVNFEEQTIRVCGKGSKTRIVPLTSCAVEAIRKYMALRKVFRGPLLVSLLGKRLSLTGLYHICRKRIGIRPHLMRHACATHMLQNGASIRVIQEILGHKDLKSTTIYTQITKNDLRDVVNHSHPRNK